MRHLVATILLFSLGTPALAQDWGRTHSVRDLESFVAQRFAGQRRVAVGAVYRAARTRGWLSGAAERKRIKRQLKTLAGERGHGRVLHLGPEPAVVATASIVTSLLGETEFNDSEGYANDLGALIVPLTASGDLSTADDVDSFRFNVPFAGAVTVSTTFSGATPDLMLSNERGDENWGNHFYGPNFTVALPAGTYHLRIGNAAGTSYTMNLGISIGALTTVPLGGQVIITAGENPGTVRLDTAADGRVRLELNAAVSTSTMVVLQSSSWSYIYESAADSQSTSGAAGLDIHLPAGTYYAYVFAAQTTSVAVSAGFTAAAVPTLAGSAAGNLVGSQEGYDLHRVVVSSAGAYRFALAGSGPSPMFDTYMRLYDVDMVEMLEGDDREVDTLSDVGVYLPVGTYYVSSDSFWEGGGYTLTMTAGSATPIAARAGSNAGSVSANGTAVFSFSLGTASRVELDMIDVTTDGQLGILDANTGRALAWEDDENLGPQDANLGMVLPAGDYLLFVRDYSGQAGAFALNVLPPLHRLPGDNVVLRGRGGSPVYMLASLAGAAASNPLPGLVTGNLLLDLPSAKIVLVPLGPSGVLDFMYSLPAGVGVYVQGVEVDVATGLGVYLNLLR